MAEIFWVIRIAGAVYIAWRVTILLGVNNPLMAIMFSIFMCIAAPIGLEWAIDRFSNTSDWIVFWDTLRNAQFVAPVAFAILGTLMWTGIEGILER